MRENKLVSPVTFVNKSNEINEAKQVLLRRPEGAYASTFIPPNAKMTIDGLVIPIEFGHFPSNKPFIDEWEPAPEDMLFNYVKGAIILPTAEFYGVKDTSLNSFVLSPKRCYNSPEMGRHMTLYLNYFEKFYDPEHELISLYYQIKYFIDIQKEKYTVQNFMDDLYRYFMRGSIFYKAKCLTADNYTLNLTYRNTKNPGLQYNDKHAKIFLVISLVMNMIIPLITHYIHVNKIAAVNDFILQAFDILLNDLFDVDICNKLFETAVSNISRNEKHNSGLWKKQDIRGKNVTTHSISSVNNIILNIIPKYVFSGNVIKMNFTSILNNTAFQVTDIGYEFNFVSLSSSKRDQENNSEFDKFESFLTKQDESLYLLNKVCSEQAMQNIEMTYGPFSDEEIRFYMRELSRDRDADGVIHPFQKELIFDLFYRYFGDPITIRGINQEDYIKLMLAAKRILLDHGMVILPYIISSRITRHITRKNINKKEQSKIELSPKYAELEEKYSNNPKIKERVISLLAQILTSDFQIIEYNGPFKELHGHKLETVMTDTIFEELFEYVVHMI